MLWGAHAPRVQISAPSPKCFACNQREDVRLYNKVRDREDALASTRDACAPRNSAAMLLKSSSPSR
jgi:hypothetical protein